jgi:clan AA aspartic protease (TIGR02281 family)
MVGRNWKKAAGALVFVWGLGMVPVQAQDGPCFLVTSSGKRTNLGALCGEAPMPEKAAKSGTYRVKIKRRLASTPVIDVNMNGKNFEMILDTGASSTLITQNMAQAMRLKPIGYREVIIADGSTVKFPVSAIKSVNVGGATARNLEVTVAQNADVGLLGHDFFGGYDVKIKRTVVEFSLPSGE